MQPSDEPLSDLSPEEQTWLTAYVIEQTKGYAHLLSPVMLEAMQSTMREALAVNPSTRQLIARLATRAPTIKSEDLPLVPQEASEGREKKQAKK